jgi:hypothetical protein
MNIVITALIALTLTGCAPFFMPPRERYDFSLTVNNDSSYTVTATISYDDKAASDECSQSSGSTSVQINPNETEQMSISTLCHIEPSSRAYVSFPRDATLEKRSYDFTSGDQVLCTDDGCTKQ